MQHFTSHLIFRSFSPVFFLVAITLLPAPISMAATLDQSTDTTACRLHPFTDVLQQTELQADGRQSPELAYQKLLSRFVSLHYTKIARHLLQGEGEYLTALDVLVGTEAGDAQRCHQLFKEMLLSTQGTSGFTQAMLLYRLPSTTAAPDTFGTGSPTSMAIRVIPD